MKRFLLLLALCVPLLASALTARAADPPPAVGELVRQGRFDEAAVQLREAIDQAPQDGGLRLLLGYALFRAGSFDQAEEVLRRGLKETGPNRDSYRLLGEIGYRRGEMEVALEAVQAALRLDPADREALALQEKIAREWQVEEKMASQRGGNFTVTYEGGGESLGAAVMATLEEAYVELGSRFEFWPERPTVVILYGNRDFRDVTGAPDWSGGLYDGKIRIPVGGVTAMTPQLRAVLYHEYVHVLVHALAGRRVPLWLNEGLAQWGADEHPPDGGRLCELSRRQGLLPLERYGQSLKGLSRSEVQLAYLQSLSLTTFLLDQSGTPEVVEVLRRLGRNEEFATAAAPLLQSWQGGMPELLRAWEASLCRTP